MPSGSVISSMNTRNLHEFVVAGIKQTPSFQRIGVDTRDHEFPEPEDVRALHVVPHFIRLMVATKQTWKPYIFMIPIGSGPPIAPCLKNFHDVRDSISLEHLQGGVQRDRIAKGKLVRHIQFGESPLNGILNKVTMLDGY